MTVPKRLAAAVFSLFLFLSSPMVLRIGASEQKPPKPEDVVERSIIFYGSRAALYGIQRNGTLRALIKFYTSDGIREGKSVTKFIRKGKLGEDLTMIEIDVPGSPRYTIGYDGQETWAIQDGEIQKPTAEVTEQFRTANEHSYEALLRYKENGAKLEFAGTNKLGTLEMYLVDMISASGIKTRYEISSRTGRIIYSNYEDSKTPPVKYRLYYKNFKPVQNTLVPYEYQVFQDGKLIEERTLIEAVFNIQLDDKDFKVENANKPPEAEVKP